MVVNRSAAPGSVVPTFVYDDVGKAVGWLCETFGFAERFHYGPDGHPTGAQLVVGSGESSWLLRASASRPNGLTRPCFDHRSPMRSHTISVQVADVDRHLAHVHIVVRAS